jgi:hypothetical protein
LKVVPSFIMATTHPAFSGNHHADGETEPSKNNLESCTGNQQARPAHFEANSQTACNFPADLLFGWESSTIPSFFSSFRIVGRWSTTLLINLTVISTSIPLRFVIA